MTPRQPRAVCLSFDAVAEEFPFDPETSVLKALGRVFAPTNLDAEPFAVDLGCDPQDANLLRAGHPDLVVAGRHRTSGTGTR